jgi:hypothetical protein
MLVKVAMSESPGPFQTIALTMALEIRTKANEQTYDLVLNIRNIAFGIWYRKIDDR